MSQYIPQDVRTGKASLHPQVAENLLYDAVPFAYTDAMEAVGPDTFNKLSPERQVVLIDMAHQLGKDGLSKFYNMKKALDSGDFETASKEMLNSKWAKKDSPNRAKRNANIMRGITRASVLETK